MMNNVQICPGLKSSCLGRIFKGLKHTFVNKAKLCPYVFMLKKDFPATHSIACHRVDPRHKAKMMIRTKACAHIMYLEKNLKLDPMLRIGP